jgi:hypothetical protein
MKQTIFHLEDRKGIYIYHFIFYNLAGLYYIENKLYNIKGRDCNKNGSTFPILNKVVAEPSQKIIYPIKIHMNDIKQFHREAFEIIKDKFILVEDLNSLEDYEVVNIYGGLCDNLNVPTTHYIRDLFIARINKPSNRNKRIFITRKNSEVYHNNTLKRYIFNENELMEALIKYNFEYIQLESLNFKEKIEIFMCSEIIISSHGSQLSFISLCDRNTNIIEICNNGTIGFPNDQNYNIASTLDLKYERYSKINEDRNGNFKLNIQEFTNHIFKNMY